MRQTFAIITIALLFCTNLAFGQSEELVNNCALNIGNATYLKDFKVKLQQSSVKPPPTSKYPVLCNKGSIYKFNTCNAAGYEGKAIVELYEHSKLLTTNVQKGEIKKAVGFFCQKGGVYMLKVHFKDGKEGAAVVVMSFMNKK